MIEVAILKNFNAGAYKAGVQLAGSLTTYFDDVNVARNIPTTAMVTGNYVILAVPGGNPKDACVIATWPGGSPAAGGGGGMEVHGNEYHDPDFEQEGVAAALLAAHKDLTTGAHGAGGNTLLHTGSTNLIGYDLLEPWVLVNLIYRKKTRNMIVQFDSYDMISQAVTGTGYTSQLFFNPRVRSGATSGGSAALYQNSEWMYANYMSFAQGGYYYTDTRNGTGFIGLARSDTHIITLNDITQHVGFIFHVNGATTTVYASNADGSTQIKTDLGVSPTAYAVWSITSSSNTMYFYRNWELVATHTTNMPAGNLCWKISVVSAQNADAMIDARSFVFSRS